MKSIEFVLILVILTIAGGALYNAIRHPCTRDRSYSCVIRECANIDGETGGCWEWREHPGTCTECVEWKP